MILHSIEDESRYTAPPELTEDHHEEPEDDIDWMEKNFPEENGNVETNSNPLYRKGILGKCTKHEKSSCAESKAGVFLFLSTNTNHAHTIRNRPHPRHNAEIHPEPPP